MVPQLGERAPEFTLPSTHGAEANLRSLLGDAKRLILAFYPKDNTSG